MRRLAAAGINRMPTLIGRAGEKAARSLPGSSPPRVATRTPAAPNSTVRGAAGAWAPSEVPPEAAGSFDRKTGASDRTR